jgi:single-stranded DNA-specific DHH superfamily exonuclease
MKDLRDTIKPQLLIIPDASGSFEQYKALNDLDIDIVVLDHHDLGEIVYLEHTTIVNN